MSEFAQLEELNAYESVDPNTLTQEQKNAALRALNLIKEKRDGTLKGRTVADGRPQRTLYDKTETASPTVSTDGLVLSIMVDAKEARDVATAGRRLPQGIHGRFRPYEIHRRLRRHPLSHESEAQQTRHYGTRAEGTLR